MGPFQVIVHPFLTVGTFWCSNMGDVGFMGMQKPEGEL